MALEALADQELSVQAASFLAASRVSLQLAAFPEDRSVLSVAGLGCQRRLWLWVPEPVRTPPGQLPVVLEVLQEAPQEPLASLTCQAVGWELVGPPEATQEALHFGALQAFVGGTCRPSRPAMTCGSTQLRGPA